MIQTEDLLSCKLECWPLHLSQQPLPNQTAAGSRIFFELSGGKHMQWPDHEDKVKIQEYMPMPHETPSTMEQKDLWLDRDPTNRIDTPFLYVIPSYIMGYFTSFRKKVGLAPYCTKRKVFETICYLNQLFYGRDTKNCRNIEEPFKTENNI